MYAYYKLTWTEKRIHLYENDIFWIGYCWTFCTFCKSIEVFLLQRVDCSYAFIAVLLISNRMELYKVMLCSERQGFIKWLYTRNRKLYNPINIWDFVPSLENFLNLALGSTHYYIQWSAERNLDRYYCKTLLSQYFPFWLKTFFHILCSNFTKISKC